MLSYLLSTCESIEFIYQIDSLLPSFEHLELAVNFAKEILRSEIDRNRPETKSKKLYTVFVYKRQSCFMLGFKEYAAAISYKDSRHNSNGITFYLIAPRLTRSRGLSRPCIILFIAEGAVKV